MLTSFDRALDQLAEARGAEGRRLAPVIEEYRARRPEGRFDKLDPNPGR